MYKSLIAGAMPEPLSRFARRIVREYRLIKSRLAPKLTEQEFQRILHAELGIRPGMVVFVHSSIGVMNLDFPSHRALALLIEVVGPDGTLLFPCTHLTEDAESFYAGGGIFDVQRSATTSGLLPELARRRKDSCRSLHPTHSVVALGKYARIMTEYHGKFVRPFSEHSPYFRLVHYESLVVGLGVDTRAMTFVHCVEDLMEERFPRETYKKELLRATVRDYAGSEITSTTLIHSTQADRRNIPRYVRRNIPPEICRDLKIHGIPYFVGRPALLLRKMEDLATEGKTIYSSWPLR